MNQFIESGKDIVDTTSLEWHHFANLSKEAIRSRWLSPTGQGLLNTLKTNNFSRQSITDHIGKFSGKYDLRGIPMVNMDISNHDFTDIDFFYADLSKTNFTACNLTGSHLSECDLTSSRFDFSNLTDVFLDNVKFNSETSFLGIDLHKVNFTFATLLYDLALTQQRIQQLQQHHKYFAKLLKYSCDYGRSFSRFFSWSLIFISLFAAMYYFFDPKPEIHSWFDYLYFSVLTFINVGSIDSDWVSPMIQTVYLLEVTVGYLMGGLLIAIFTKRVMG
jgi:hypothetical protein